MDQKTALVIDPGHEVGEKLSQILQPLGWTIREVPDNSAALKLVESTQFDLILTNERTSTKEDIELLRSIRRLHPHTRMIILTDESTPRDVLQAMREKVFSYFSRPFSFESLAAMIQDTAEEPSWDDGIEVLTTAARGVRLLVRSDIHTANRLLHFMEEMIDIPETEKLSVASALRELLMNAIEHGAKFDRGQYVELSYIHTKRAVACRIKDPGKGFSFDEIAHGAVSNPPDDPLRHLHYRAAANLRPGGFGVLLARNLVDELIYNDEGNEVLLIKYI